MIKKNCACRTFFKSSIGKKMVMAITGLMLAFFALTHLLGNFLLFKGAEAFNHYAHLLISSPLIYIAEVGLVVVFLTHMLLAACLTIENRRARPQNYYYRQKSGRGATLASSTMPYTGTILLLFLIAHLCNFKYGPTYMVELDGQQVRDLYTVVMNFFKSPWYTLGYVIAFLAIALHLSHGVGSAFRSLGFSHPRYTPTIDCISKLYGVFIGLGYSSIAIWAYLKGVML